MLDLILTKQPNNIENKLSPKWVGLRQIQKRRRQGGIQLNGPYNLECNKYLFQLNFSYVL